MDQDLDVNRTRIRYTLKFLFGALVLGGIAWLTYWLLFEYQVRNVLGLSGIIVFLGVPTVISLFKIPGELVALREIWRADDPEALEEAIAFLRGRDLL